MSDLSIINHLAHTAASVVTAILPIAASIRTDLHFFREVSGRSTAGAWFDVVLLRAISWTVFIAYFFGTSIYGRAMSILSELAGG